MKEGGSIRRKRGGERRNKKVTRRTLLGLFSLSLLIGTIFAALIYVGRINMPYEVKPPKAEMVPATLDFDIGTIYLGQIKTQGFLDSGADIVVNEITDIQVTLEGEFDKIAPFIVEVQLQVPGTGSGPEVELYVLTGGISGTFTNGFSAIAIGTYDIFVSYEISGTSLGSGAISLKFDWSL